MCLGVFHCRSLSVPSFLSSLAGRDYQPSIAACKETQTFVIAVSRQDLEIYLKSLNVS